MPQSQLLILHGDWYQTPDAVSSVSKDDAKTHAYLRDVAHVDVVPLPRAGFATHVGVT